MNYMLHSGLTIKENIEIRKVIIFQIIEFKQTFIFVYVCYVHYMSCYITIYNIYDL